MAVGAMTIPVKHMFNQKKMVDSWSVIQRKLYISDQIPMPAMIYAISNAPGDFLRNQEIIASGNKTSDVMISKLAYV